MNVSQRHSDTKVSPIPSITRSAASYMYSPLRLQSSGPIKLAQRIQPDGESCERMTLNINSSPHNSVGHRKAAFVSKSKLGFHD